ncbi:MAG: hypothetical protein Ta2E_04050 [Mycoplasmoidaceae bacterium]|nr:MAG: hypothetical protein Ta2E_04050 [Mycoplasmoidaceae bacterium]
MIICILAGGEGSRLWPLSTPLKPKQIIALSGEKSLIHNTYNLMQKITKDIFIVSEQSHYKEMLKQLTGFDSKKMIVEPCRKGTTNCTLLAISFIKKYYKDKKNDDKILFIHADHIFDNENKFISSIKQAFTIQKNDNVVIGGKKPTNPGTKYGYVETKKINSTLYKVNKFLEKPSIEIATKLYKKPNYFWNEGFFICTINGMINNLKLNNIKVYNDLVKLTNVSNSNITTLYKTLTISPIEKSLMEKSNNIVLSPIDFSWVDLGTYNSLCSILNKDKTNIVKGNNIYELENTNTFIHNSTNLNIGVVGLNNVAVVLTNDGLLVLNKDKENLVSTLSKQMKK